MPWIKLVVMEVLALFLYHYYARVSAVSTVYNLLVYQVYQQELPLESIKSEEPVLNVCKEKKRTKTKASANREYVGRLRPRSARSA
jgi:hypothetical protein